MSERGISIRISADGTVAVNGVRLVRTELGSLEKDQQRVAASSNTLSQATQNLTSQNRSLSAMLGQQRAATTNLDAGYLGLRGSLNAVSGGVYDLTKNNQALATSSIGLSHALNQQDKAISGNIASFGMMGRILPAIGFYQVAKQIITTSDTMTNMESRLKLVTNGSRELTTAQSELYKVAIETRQSLADTGDIYFRVAKGAAAYGLTQKDQIELARTINQTVILSGANAVSAQAALIQFGQALSSGVLRGQELNSILEQAPALADAIAKGMGKSTDDLLALGAAGKITVEEIVRALQKQAGAVDADFGKMSATISGAWQNVESAAAHYVSQANAVTGFNSTLASSILFVGDNFSNFAAVGLATASVGLGGYVGKAWAARAATIAHEAEQTRLAATSIGLNSALGMQAAKVTASGAAMGVARGLVTALGGPIGIVTTLLGLGATAWLTWGNNAESAGNKAKTAIADAQAELDRYNKQKRIDSSGGNTIAPILDDAEKRYAAALAKGQAAAVEMQKIQTQYNGKAGPLQIPAINQDEIDQAKSALDKIRGSYEKLNEAIKKAASEPKGGLTDFMINPDFNTKADDVQAKLLELSIAFAKHAKGLDTSSKEYQVALARFNAKKDEYLGVDKANKKDATEEQQRLKAYTDTISKINEFKTAQQLELDSTEKLTAGQRLSLDIMEQIRTGKLKLIGDEQKTVKAMLESALATEKLTATEQYRHDKVAAMVEVWKAENKAHSDGLAESSRSYNELASKEADQVRAVQEQIDVLKYGAVATAESKNQRLLEAAAAFEQNAAYAAQNGVAAENIKSMLDRAAALRELAASQGMLAAKSVELKKLEEQKDYAKQFGDNLNRAITDSLVRGLDSTESYGKAVLRNLANYGKSILIKIPVDLIMRPIATAIGTAVAGVAIPGASFAQGESAGLPTGASSGFTLSNLADVIAKGFDSTNLAYYEGIAKFGDTLRGLGLDEIGKFININSTMIGKLSPLLPSVISLLKGDIKGAAFSGAGAAIGMALGGPLGGAIGSFLGSSLSGVFGEHVSRPKYYANTLVNATTAKNISAYGNSDANGDGGGVAIKAGISIGTAIQKYTNALEGKITKQFVVGSNYQQKYNTFLFSVGKEISKNGSNADFQFKATDSKAAAGAAANAFFISVKRGYVDLAGYQEAVIKRTPITLTSANANIKNLDYVISTFNSMKTLPPVFNALGTTIQNFTKLSRASIADLQSQQTAISTYYDLFYKDNEKLSWTAKQLAAQVKTVDAPMFTSRDSFRAYVDGIDTTNKANLKQFNFLVSMAPAFDAYFKGMDQQNAALQESADNALSIASNLRKKISDAMYGNQLPEQQLSTITAQFDQAYAKALVSSGSALTDQANVIADLIDPLLQSAKDVYASGSEFQDIKQYVFEAGNFIADKVDPNGANKQIAVNTADTVKQLQAIIDQQGAGFTMMIEKLDAMANELEELKSKARLEAAK